MELFCVFYGKPDYLLACKLKALKGNLKEWSRNEQGSLSIQRANLLNQMARLDSLLDKRALTQGQALRGASILVEYEELL